MGDTDSKRPVVFLDRDGTLNIEKGYIHDTEDLVLIEGAGEAVKRLNNAGIAAILVSNQSGAARNFYPLSHIEALHKRLARLLKEEGAYLDALYYCPHHPAGVVPELTVACDCRKPLPGLVERAYLENPDLNRHRSFVIGDKTNDLGLANRCGAKCILVETGFGKHLIESKEHLSFFIDFQAKSVVEAVDWVIHQCANATKGSLR